MKSLNLYFFLSLFLFSVNVFGQEVFQPVLPRQEMEALKIDENLKIDGHLEPLWQRIKPTQLGFQVEPFQGQKATFGTQVRVAYNKHFLYVSAICHEPEGHKALRVPNFRRDFDFGSNDIFGIAIDGFNDKRNAMALVTNPYGVQRDLLSFDDQIYDEDWDGLWRVRTSRTDSNWVAEFAIPWQTLRYPKTTESTQNWGINFSRNRRKTNELSTWSPYPRTMGVLRMDYAGVLKNIQPPLPTANIRVTPYLLVADHKTTGSELGNDHTTTVKAGGEVKWAVNTNTVIDLTYNTDFAQADADRQVNNLTRFSVFFPERRAFFLENAGLFGVGLTPLDDFWGGQMNVQPFFSRTIGLDANGNPVPIDFGARLVSRNEKRNFGALFMKQQASATDPQTFFSVGRYSQNFGEQNRVGGIFTVKNHAYRHNLTGSVDAFFRLNQTLNLTTMAMFSGSNNDSRTGQGKDNGFSGFYQLQHSGIKWNYWLVQSITTQNFNPEMGFVSRNDVIETSPGFFWLYRGSKLPKFIRAFEPGGYILTYHQPHTMNLVEQQIMTNPIWFSFQNGAGFGLFANHFYQRIDTEFDPLGLFNIQHGKYQYYRYQVFAASDASKKISGRIFYDTGGYYDGQLASTSLSVSASPIPHVNVRFSLQNDKFKNVGEDKFSETIRLWSIESRLALNPRLQMIGFYQHNSASNRDNVNLRLSWEFQPLSYFFVVWNKRSFDAYRTMLGPNGSRIPTAEIARQTDQQSIVKLSYLKQF